MKSIMRRSLTALMGLAVMLTMMPLFQQGTYAAGPANVESEIGTPTINDDKVKTTVVNYGGHSWYLVQNENGRVRLLAKDPEFGKSPFRELNSGGGLGFAPYNINGIYTSHYAVNPGGTETNPGWTHPNEYKGSALEQKMNEIIYGAGTTFSTKEQTIAEDFGAVDNNYSYNINAELCKYMIDRDSSQWWTSSPYAQSTMAVGVDSYSGYGRVITDIHWPHYVRPNFKLNAANILLTSNSRGGKSTTTVGDGLVNANAIADSTATNPVKYTIKDDARSRFSAQKTKKTGRVVTVSYANAQTGSNEFVSAVIKDKDGKAKYYGKLVSSSASGSVDVTMPADFDEDNDKLYVFNEQINGERNSDFSSALIEIKFEKNRQADSSTPTAASKDKKSKARGKSPKTGDDTDMVLWIALMAAACTGIGATLYKRRKVS